MTVDLLCLYLGNNVARRFQLVLDFLGFFLTTNIKLGAIGKTNQQGEEGWTFDISLG